MRPLLSFQHSHVLSIVEELFAPHFFYEEQAAVTVQIRHSEPSTFSASCPGRELPGLFPSPTNSAAAPGSGCPAVPRFSTGLGTSPLGKFIIEKCQHPGKGILKIHLPGNRAAHLCVIFPLLQIESQRSNSSRLMRIRGARASPLSSGLLQACSLGLLAKHDQPAVPNPCR